MGPLGDIELELVRLLAGEKENGTMPPRVPLVHFAILACFRGAVRAHAT